MTHEERLEELFQTCARCEGNGLLYADGRTHYHSEQAPTIPCGVCSGTGTQAPTRDDLLRIFTQVEREARAETWEAASQLISGDVLTEDEAVEMESRSKLHCFAALDRLQDHCDKQARALREGT